MCGGEEGGEASERKRMTVGRGEERKEGRKEGREGKGREAGREGSQTGDQNSTPPSPPQTPHIKTFDGILLVIYGDFHGPYIVLVGQVKVLKFFLGFLSFTHSDCYEGASRMFLKGAALFAQPCSALYSSH